MPDAPPATADARVDAPPSVADAAVDGGGPTADACTPDPFCAGKTAGNYCDGNGTRTCTLVGGCLKASAVVACAGASTCSAGACTCPANVCQTAGTENVSVCTGNGYTMCGAKDAGGCIAPAAAQPTLCGDLTCKSGAATAADACVCPTAAATAGPEGKVGCDTVNAQICSTPTAEGYTNVLVCRSADVAGPGGTPKSCNVWQIFGGAGGEGDCAAATVTCNTTSHVCECPDPGRSATFFADPTIDRTVLASRNIRTTGVQTPAICAFENFARALNTAKATINPSTGTANHAYVVLAGGTNAAPAVFGNEPAGTFPAEIPDGITVTVDTDTQVQGITVPTKTADARAYVLVITDSTPKDGLPPAGLVLTGGANKSGGQLHGFTVIGGDCTRTEGHACAPRVGIFVVGYGDDAVVTGGRRARLDQMIVQGGGGPVIASTTDIGGTLAPVTATFTAGTDSRAANGTLTFSATFANADAAAAALAAGPRFVALNSATPGFSGYYYLDPAQGSVAGTPPAIVPDGAKVTFTVSTNNKAGLANGATAANASLGILAFGGLTDGIVLSSTAGTYSNNIVENFPYGRGILVESTYRDATVNSTATFTGFWLYNNNVGFEAQSGLVEIQGPPSSAPAGYAPTSTPEPFLTAQTYAGGLHETIERSFTTGLWAHQVVGMDKPALAIIDGVDPQVHAASPAIIHTGPWALTPSNLQAARNTAGVLVQNGSMVTIDFGIIDTNYDHGAMVEATPAAGVTSLTATSTTFNGNFRGVDTSSGNTTLNVSFANSNDEIGVWHRASGSYQTTINGGRVDANEWGVYQTVGNVLIQAQGANTAQIADNARQGVWATGVSAITIKDANILRNGAGYETADGEASCVAHTYGVEIDPAAVMTMVTSHVDSNHGGGVLVASVSADNSISGGTVNGNGVGTTKDCSFEASEDAYSGVAVAPGGSLKLGAQTLVDNNRDDGYVVAGTLTSSGANGIEAKANGKSGVKALSTGSVAITTGGTVTGNCAALEKEPNAGITNLGTLAVDTTRLNIISNQCDGVYVESSGNTSIALALIDANVGNGVNATRTWVAGNAFDAADSAINAWGLVLDTVLVTNNAGVAGIYLKGGAGNYAPRGNVAAIIRDSNIGFNKVGVEAAAGAGGYNTGITAIQNPQIMLNTGAGMIIDTAYVLDARLPTLSDPIGQFFAGLSSNTIAHNGFAPGDTECKTGQSAAQIIFSGAAPGGGVTNCAAAVDANDCTTGAAYVDAHCVWTGDTSRCQRGYHLNHLADCNHANTITSYETMYTAVSGLDTVVGLLATNGAFVDIDGNRWGKSTPAENADYRSSAGGAVNSGATTCNNPEPRCLAWLNP